MSLESVFSEFQKPQQYSFTGYEFEGIPELYADHYGNFWYKGKMIEKKYRDRQVFLNLDGVRYGIVTLRKLAKKTNIDFMPF